jgi:ABC-2 type transport system ATP-binding protein
MIHVESLTRRYGDVVAIEGVTTRIGRGEIVGLLGHNGAGKTTMMKVITGALEPSEGAVRVDDLDVVTERESVQRRMGYLPENAPLYPEMTVREYLHLLAGLRGVAPKAEGSAVQRAAESTGLVDRLDWTIDTLSKGFRQRVGLAQAIVHSPAVLVLDEPTNGLDPAQIAAIRTLIRRLGEEGETTILLSTHILQEVEAVCDRVMVLIQGRLVADAPLKELLAGQAVVLSVEDGSTGMEQTLTALPGAETVTFEGPDATLPGFSTWRVTGDPSTLSSADIAQAVHRAGWKLAALAPERRTLEGVFRELELQAAQEGVA